MDARSQAGGDGRTGGRAKEERAIAAERRSRTAGGRVQDVDGRTGETRLSSCSASWSSWSSTKNCQGVRGPAASLNAINNRTEHCL